MKEAMQKLAARLAVLQNNLDVYEDEQAMYERAGDNRMVEKYNLAMKLVEAEIHGITESCAAFGFYLQLDGPRTKRTCALRLSAVFTSHAGASVLAKRVA